MADLLATGAILRVEVPLDPEELPLRILYGTPTFVKWLDERVRAREASRLRADTTPLEQLEALFYRFVSGRPLHPRSDLRCIKVERNPVWELKTLEWRVFGWFPLRDCFVCLFGDWTDHVKQHDLYRGYRLEVRRIRRELAVREDLCGKGVTAGDVLSS